MDLKKYTEANREAWNEVTPIHQRARKENLTEEFKKKGYSTLDELITLKFRELSIEGKAVAQLCCNNGREVLSLINLGAKYGVGFDISDEAIKEAENLAAASGLNCRFVRTDVYDIGEEFHDSFDLVYISIGGLAWLPDLNVFFKIVADILKAGGTLVVYDSHPVVNMFLFEGEEGFDPANPAKVGHSYFRTEPWVGNSGIDYLGKTKYQSKTSYDFSHTLSQIFTAIIGSGINITEFYEYPHDISNESSHLEKDKKLPLSYILVGKKDVS